MRPRADTSVLAELQRKNATLEGVNRIFREALSAESDERLARLCLAVAEDLTGAAFSFLGEINFETNRLDDLSVGERGWTAIDGGGSAARRDQRSADLAIEGVCARVLIEGESLIANDPQTRPEPIASPEGHPPLRCFLGVPLKRDGRTIGMMGLGNREGGFRPEDLEAVEALTPAILQALASKRAEVGRRESEERLRQLQAHQQILIGELQHRVRNILTVIRSVFSRTMEAGGDLEDMANHFRGRLDALARTQAVAIKSVEGLVDLEDLIRDELLSVGVSDGPSLFIRGPEVRLSSKAAESIGLAIHELTTNALKFGALKPPGGKLTIRWKTNPDYAGAPRLDLVWLETGVPAVAVDPVREGFGRELIEEALPYRLGAETKLEFLGGGVRCRMSLPLSADEVGARAEGLGW